MNEPVKLDSYYETRCGLVAKVRAIDTSKKSNVIATVLFPPHSVDPESPGKEHSYDKGMKANRTFGLHGEATSTGAENPYDFMREVEKPADWDDLPDPAFT